MRPLDDAASDNDGRPVPDFPTYVRWLAVLHVLSYSLAAVAFVVLMATACFLKLRRGQVDETVLVLGGLALACPPIGMIFRSWFVRFGRRHWPEDEESSADDSVSQP